MERLATLGVAWRADARTTASAERTQDRGSLIAIWRADARRTGVASRRTADEEKTRKHRPPIVDRVPSLRSGDTTEDKSAAERHTPHPPYAI